MTDKKNSLRTKSIFCVIFFVSVVLVLLSVLIMRNGKEKLDRNGGNIHHCSNTLKRIGSAMNLYFLDYGSYPPSMTINSNGNAVHGWRSMLLPYFNIPRNFDEKQLWYTQDNLDMRYELYNVYVCNSEYERASNTTSYMMIVGPNCISDGLHARSKKEITRPHDEVIWCLEVSNSGVHYLEPVDFPVENFNFGIRHFNKEHDDFQIYANSRHDFGDGREGILALTLSGKVLRLSADTSPEILIRLASIADDEHTIIKKLPEKDGIFDVFVIENR